MEQVIDKKHITKKSILEIIRFLGNFLLLLIMFTFANIAVDYIYKYTAKPKTIFYDKDSIQNLSTKYWFDGATDSENFENRKYVIEVCNKIALGLWDFDFNYKPACKIVGVDV